MPVLYSLTSFIQRAYADIGLPVRRENGLPFYDDRHNIWLLSGQENVVIVYPGIFNPPHRGHHKLLQHVCRNYGSSNVAGAVVIPHDDWRLSVKLQHEKNPLKLTKQQRASIWRRAPDMPRNRFWVFDGPESEWHQLSHQIEIVSVEHGFPVRFVLLVGPDLFTPDRGINYLGYGEMVTSDISRPASFRRGHLPLVLNQLHSSSHWLPIPSYECGPLAAQVHSVHHTLRDDDLPTRFGPFPYDPTAQAQVARCLSQVYPEMEMRFFRFVACINLQGSIPDISSTEIRRILATAPSDRVESLLEDMALSPKILVELAADGGPYTEPVPRPKVTYIDLEYEAPCYGYW